MVRPRLCRKIRVKPRSSFFKPRGITMRNLEIIELAKEEVEALRLKNVSGYDQAKCAKIMNTSKSTFQRILTSAQAKVSEAIVTGKAIAIEE